MINLFVYLIKMNNLITTFNKYSNPLFGTQDNNKKETLISADCFHILQGNDTFYYQNMRIIRNDGKYKYVGVTHEYIDRPPGNKTGAFKKEENKRGEYCERQQQLHTVVSSLDTRARARLRGGCAGVPPLRLLICRLKGAFASAVDNFNRGFGKAAISSVENLKQRTGTRRAADPIVITCDPGSFQLTRITCDQGVTKRGHHHSMKWSRG